MQKRHIVYNIQGMGLDVISSPQNTTMAYSIKNMRLTPTKDSNALELTTERGTELIDIEGDSFPDNATVISYCTLQEYLVLFITAEKIIVKDQWVHGPDYIYRLEKTNAGYINKLLFEGDLNFDVNSEIEATSYFENTKVQKIYWVDGINQPRVINIHGNEDDNPSTSNPTFPKTDFNASHTEFDFLLEVLTNEEDPVTHHIGSSARIKAKKLYTGGNFTSGVIQYAYSLYTSNSLETPLIDITSLLYITHNDRGGAPNEQCGCSFEITIENKNLKNRFDYIRVYSILRNSLNGTPLARVVADIPFNEEVIIIDDGNGGYDTDYNQLQYQRIPMHPLTLTLKDNVLFMGNYDLEYNINDLSTLYDKDIDIQCENWYPELNVGYDDIYAVKVYDENDISVYPWLNQLNTESAGVKTFKYGETYKLGVQFQDKYGNWSLPYFIKDVQQTLYPLIDVHGNLHKPIFACKINDIFNELNSIEKANYIRIRPVVSFPTLSERSILCQGVLNPTVFNITERCNKTSYAQSSWFFRPIIPHSGVSYSDSWKENMKLMPNENLSWYSNKVYAQQPYGADLSFEHYDGLCDSTNIGGEIQGMFYDKYLLDVFDRYDNFNDEYYIPNYLGWHANRDYVSSIKNDHDVDRTPKRNFTNVLNIDNNNVNNYKNFYFIDLSVLTLNSPNFFEDKFKFDNQTNFDINITGVVLLSSNNCQYSIISENPLFLNSKALKDHSLTHYIRSDIMANGFLKVNILNTCDVNNFKHIGILCALNCWFDDYSNYFLDEGGHAYVVRYLISQSIGYSNSMKSEIAYTVYPWQRRFLNNFNYGMYYDDDNGYYQYKLTTNDDTETSKISSKILSNFRYSLNTNFIDSTVINEQDSHCNLAHNGIYFHDDNGTKLLNINNNKIYSGNYNKSLLFNGNYCAKTYIGYGSSGGLVYEYLSKQGYPINFFTLFTDLLIYDGDIRGSFPGYGSGPSKILDYDNYVKTSQSIPSEIFEANYMTPYQMKTYINTGSVRLAAGCNTNSQDVIEIKYKSSPHIVFQLLTEKYNDKNYQNVIPKLNLINNTEYRLFNNDLVWADENNYDNNIDGVIYKSIDDPLIDLQNNNYLFIADVNLGLSESYVNEWIPSNNSNQEGILTNKSNLYLRNWVPVGKAQLFIYDENNPDTNLVAWIEGDTYYQRYDCVKTKPYSDEDYQSVIDVLSFMVESSINLDGRYDKNRKTNDYSLISDDNFNLFNDVYNQENNFFTYLILDPAKFNVDEFRNDVVWSAKKISGESIDKWTKLSSINQLQLDGNKGHVKALRKFNDNIYCFQDHATSRIRFNDRTAIATESGEPLQLAHTNYVDGYEYVNSDVGCQYGISCCETENGIFFINNDIPGIYKLSYNEYGNVNIKNITKERLMQRWFENIGNVNKTRVFFDKPVNEILTLNSKTLQSNDNGYCLSFSCDMNAFQQFIDYEKAQYILTHNNWPVAVTNINGDIELWKLRNGSFASFFGLYRRPYGLKFIASPPRTNEGLVIDCIYDNLSYKADMFVGPNGDDANLGSYSYQPNESFDSINVYSIYQSLDNDESLSYTNQPHHSISNLRKKFGVWFARIPRFSDISQPQGRYNKERMRGSKLMIDLMKNQPGVTNSKLVLKELSVDCFY